MFSLFQSNKPPYSTQKIAAGKFLDKAEEVDVPFFFHRWMQKKPRKAPVGYWFLIHEDNKYVYWCWPIFKALFSDDRSVKRFYKTNKEALNQAFPNYKKIYGNAIRLKLQEVIRESFTEQIYASVPLGFKTQLLDTTISITTYSSIKPYSTKDVPEPKSKTAFYKVIFDKNNLDLIHLEEIKV
jgi:hypothetical protein